MTITSAAVLRPDSRTTFLFSLYFFFLVKIIYCRSIDCQINRQQRSVVGGPCVVVRCAPLTSFCLPMNTGFLPSYSL